MEYTRYFLSNFHLVVRWFSKCPGNDSGSSVPKLALTKAKLVIFIPVACEREWVVEHILACKFAFTKAKFWEWFQLPGNECRSSKTTKHQTTKAKYTRAPKRVYQNNGTRTRNKDYEHQTQFWGNYRSMRDTIGNERKAQNKQEEIEEYLKLLIKILCDQKVHQLLSTGQDWL